MEGARAEKKAWLCWRGMPLCGGGGKWGIHNRCVVITCLYNDIYNRITYGLPYLDKSHSIHHHPLYVKSSSTHRIVSMVTGQAALFSSKQVSIPCNSK